MSVVTVHASPLAHTQSRSPGVHGAHRPVMLQPSVAIDDGCAAQTLKPAVVLAVHGTPTKPATHTPVPSQLRPPVHVPPMPLLPPKHTPLRLPRFELSIWQVPLLHVTPVEHEPLLHGQPMLPAGQHDMKNVGGSPNERPPVFHLSGSTADRTVIVITLTLPSLATEAPEVPDNQSNGNGEGDENVYVVVM